MTQKYIDNTNEQYIHHSYLRFELLLELVDQDGMTTYSIMYVYIYIYIMLVSICIGLYSLIQHCAFHHTYI